MIGIRQDIDLYSNLSGINKIRSSIYKYSVRKRIYDSVNIDDFKGISNHIVSYLTSPVPYLVISLMKELRLYCLTTNFISYQNVQYGFYKYH